GRGRRGGPGDPGPCRRGTGRAGLVLPRQPRLRRGRAGGRVLLGRNVLRSGFPRRFHPLPPGRGTRIRTPYADPRPGRGIGALRDEVARSRASTASRPGRLTRLRPIPTPTRPIRTRRPFPAGGYGWGVYAGGRGGRIRGPREGTAPVQPLHTQTTPRIAGRKRVERMRRLLTLLADRTQQAPLTLDELVAELGVSKATLRRDLAVLEDERLVVRTHGG